jgi:hypothetical protein
MRDVSIMGVGQTIKVKNPQIGMTQSVGGSGASVVTTILEADR